jgi:hypothetical protein
MITTVRWVLLVNGVVVLLGATVLHRPFRALFVDPYLRLGARVMGRDERAEVPWVFREGPMRVWSVVMGVMSLAAWWYLGTPAGAAAASRFLSDWH